MISRRAALKSAAPLAAPPFALGASPKTGLAVPEAGLTITAPLTVNVINGHKFAFSWDLEPGDVVHAYSLPRVHGVFFERMRRGGNEFLPFADEYLSAWNFHEIPWHYYAGSGSSSRQPWGIRAEAMLLKGHRDPGLHPASTGAKMIKA